MIPSHTSLLDTFYSLVPRVALLSTTQVCKSSKTQKGRWRGGLGIRLMCVLPVWRISRNQVDASVPRQFHFANIHRAEVHNVLVAGGFGTPAPPLRPTFFPPEPLVSRETVSVRANYQVHQNGAAGLVSRRGGYSDSPQDQGQGYAQEPIVSESTPFFHVDLVAAVRAAEKLGSKNSENGPNGGSQGDILIDLHN